MVAFWRDPLEFLVSLAREHGDVARFRWGRSDEYLLNHPDTSDASSSPRSGPS
jgi:hypothetical protein